MPPRRVPIEKAGASKPQQDKGFVSSTYETLTSSENAPIVRSVVVFGAAVTFLSSSWGELLLPPQ